VKAEDTNYRRLCEHCPKCDITGARCQLCLRNTFRSVFEVECVYSLYHMRAVSNERLNS
jgi:hypothetical protein